MIKLPKCYALLVLILIVSCAKQPATPETDLAKTIALIGELQGTHEAVVWVYDKQGLPHTYWIKTGPSGVSTMAARDELVIPWEGALWQFAPIEDIGDINQINMTDLVSGDTRDLILDENAIQEEDTDDALSVDAGTGERPQLDTDSDTSTPAKKETQDTEDDPKQSCDAYKAQTNLAVLASLGPYLFVRYEERTYDCEETLVLLEDRFRIFDLSNGSTADILSIQEKEKLFEFEDVENLQNEGAVNLVGIVPFYTADFSLHLTYHFAAKTITLTETGERHSLVSSIQVPARILPQALLFHAQTPDFVRVFTLSTKGIIPGGYWLVRGDAKQITAQLSAFALKESKDTDHEF